MTLKRNNCLKTVWVVPERFFCKVFDFCLEKWLFFCLSYSIIYVYRYFEGCFYLISREYS